MFGRKRAFFGAVVVAMMLLGGCGGTTNTLGGAMDGSDTTNGATSGSGTTDSSGSNGGTNTGSNGGTESGGMMQDGRNDSAIYWDGYGIDTGKPLSGSNGERNTYGMRIDGNGITVGQELKNAWDDMTGNQNSNTNHMYTGSAAK